MSIELLSRPDYSPQKVELSQATDDFEEWEAELAGVKKGLGATACAGCPLMKNNECPGKASALQECPPVAKAIKKEHIPSALLDDTVTGVSMDGAGGFIVHQADSRPPQPKPLTVPRPNANKQAAPAVAAASKTLPERKMTHRNNKNGVLRSLGQFAAMIFGVIAPAPVKK